MIANRTKGTLNVLRLIILETYFREVTNLLTTVTGLTCNKLGANKCLVLLCKFPFMIGHLGIIIYYGFGPKI